MPILIPQGQPSEVLAQLLHKTQSEVLFAPAGVVSPDQLNNVGSSLKHIIWFVEPSSRHMDFLQPESGNNSSQYHTLVDEGMEKGTSELPSDTELKNAPNVISIWQGKNAESYEVVEFTQSVRLSSNY